MKFVKTDKNYAKFTFEVTPQEFEHGLEHAFNHIKGDVEIKGFRKGHVTQAVYEKKFGEQSLYVDALNHVISHLFQQALQEPSITVVSEPTNVDVDIEKIDRKKPFEVSFDVAVKPEVELGQYIGLEIKGTDVSVSDEEVQSSLDGLLSEGATLEPKDGDTLEQGDTAIFDFEGFQDGVAFEGGKAENFSLKIGSGQFIPGFEEGMLGLKVGEQREVNVTFPEQYQAENLAGKPAVFKVKLHEIKATKSAGLTDEWVKTLNREGIETVDALKKSLEEELKTQKESQAKNQTIDEVLKLVVDNAKVDVPKEMIDSEIENFKKNVEQQAKQYQLELAQFIQMSGLTEEQFEQQAKEQSEKRVLQSLIIEAVAAKEGFTATKEELDKRYEELATHYKMPVEEIKKYVSDQLVTNDIAFEKAVDFMVEKSVKK